VRVRATSVNYGDLTARNFPAIGPERFNMIAPLFYGARLAFGWSRPRNPILGSEYAGEVEATGDGVTRFRPGDRVLGYRGQRMGAHAEYLVERAEGMIAPLPDSVSFEDAAVLPYGGTTAFALLETADLQHGERILVIGASGSIGMAAVQIARARGAHVTGVAGPQNQELVLELGAHAVLDHTRDDLTAAAAPYDLIFDVRGRLGFDRARQTLTPAGCYFPVSFKGAALLDAIRTRRSRGQRVRIALAPEQPEILERVAAMIGSGELRAAPARTFALADGAAAHQYVEDGHKSGHIALRV
jgi:NADPH:quinone reductase-like Zn-dependent oxidoreductase